MDSRPAEIRHGVLHVRRHAPATTPGGPARRLASPHTPVHAPVTAASTAASARADAGTGVEFPLRPTGFAHLPMLHLTPTPLRQRAESDAHAVADAHAETFSASHEGRPAREHAAAPLPLQRLQPVRRPPQALRLLLLRQPDAAITRTGDGVFAAAGASSAPAAIRSESAGSPPAGIPAAAAAEIASPVGRATSTRTPHRTLGESLRSLAESVLHPGRSTETPGIQRTMTSGDPGRSATKADGALTPAASSAHGAFTAGARPAPDPGAPLPGGALPRPDDLLRGAARRSARPLPAWAVPLARRITGVPETPLLAEGREAQQVLEPLGARGATLDGTVFVSQPVTEPTPQAAEILAHEFVHVSERPRAPRYFPGILDAGERLARGVGRQAMSAARQAPQQLGGIGGAASDAVDRGRSALSGAADRSLPQIGQLASEGTRRLTSAASGAGGAASGALASARGTAEEQIEAARGMASGYTGRGISALRGGIGQATGAARGMAGPVLSRLGSLAVPGASALAGSAEQGIAGLESRAGDALDSLSGAAESGLGGLGGMASGAIGQAAQFGQEALDSGVSGAQEGVAAASGALGGVLAGAQSALGTAGAAGEQAAGSIGAMLGGGASSALDATSQMGELMELIEDRIVAEIERRGGRFQGAF